MSLPIIDVAPEHSLKIPSSGQEVTFRPYLVKEEKVLMIALESEDPKQMMQAIATVISNCVEDPINLDTLALFDIEYMFLQIRAKSVGETTAVKIKCQQDDCAGVTEVACPLDQIVVQPDPTEVDKNIQVTDSVSLGMRFPQFGKVRKNNKIYKATEKKQTEAMFELIELCIDTVATADSLVSFDDSTAAERENFLDRLKETQFNKLKEFTAKMPVMKTTVEFNCAECSKENKVEVEGLRSFFN